MNQPIYAFDKLITAIEKPISAIYKTVNAMNAPQYYQYSWNTIHKSVHVINVFASPQEMVFLSYPGKYPLLIPQEKLFLLSRKIQVSYFPGECSLLTPQEIVFF